MQELGIGRFARRIGDVAAAVGEVVADPAYGRAARSLAARIASQDGAEACADVVEEVVGRSG